jgi:hypothetical protein
MRNPSSTRDENNRPLEPHHYPLRPDPQTTLLSPLQTPSHRRCNNLVSDVTTGASVTMSCPDNRPPGASTDFGKQVDLVDTLNSIMAQLTLIGSHLDLQGATLACHAQLLDSAEGSTPPIINLGAQGPGGAGHGFDTSSGAGGATDGSLRPNNHRDNHVDLRNSFHQPKLSFPRYDGSTDPLPWLNRCESYFHCTRTVAAEQVWLSSLHLDDVTVEWYYSLEKEYGLAPWLRFAEFINLRFGPPIRSNPLGELKELYRTGTINDYQCQFLTPLSLRRPRPRAQDESIHHWPGRVDAIRRRNAAVDRLAECSEFGVHL